MIKESSIKSNW